MTTGAPSGAAVDTRARLVTPVFLQLLLTQALFGLCWSMFLVVPKFVVQQFRADPAQVGWISAVPGAAMLLSVPLVSRYIDRVAARWFVSGGSLMGAAAAVGMATLPVLDWRIYAYQAVQGLGFVLCFNAGAAMAAGLAPRNGLGRALALFGAANMSMNGVSPFIGELLHPAHGWRGVYLFAALAGLLATLVAAFLPREAQREPKSVDAPVSDGTWSFMSWALARVVISAALGAFAFMALFAFHQPFALAAGIVEVRDYFFGFVLFALALRFGMGGLSDRIGTHRVARAAQLAYVVPPIALALLGPHYLFVAGSLHGLVHGAHFPAMSALAVERVDPSARGRALTLLVGAFNGGTSVASYVLGPIAKAFGFEAAFVVGAAVAFVGVFTLGPAVPPRPRNSHVD